MQKKVVDGNHALGIGLMPGRQAERRVEDGRLVYYLRAADAAFWDQHWKTSISPELYEKTKHGYLGQFEDLFVRYLPRRGRILEAGCGLGQHVQALCARGYDIEGVDWAPETVKAVNALYPDLPIRVGDVTRLEVPDGYYSGYISLGVVEHRQEGPEPFLHEAYRVLEPGGVAFISVPYFNSLRRLKAHLERHQGQTEGLEFYQYAFTKTEFTKILRAAGFKIIDQGTYGGAYCVKAEIPQLAPVFRYRGIGWRLRNWLYRRKFIKTHLDHMFLMVCQKGESS